MRCEICGKTIQGKPRKIIVERAKLMVCEECAKHSSISWEFEKPTVSIPKPLGKPSPKTVKSVLDEDFMLVEGYGLKVKMEREKRGWTQEDLASKIGEKASFIGKIETEKVIPNLTVVRKLEHVLGVKLVTKELPVVNVNISPPKNHGLTIGDLLNFNEQTKKGGKSESHTG
ncbi:TIGR00270 family protein [Candidatus Bathyarchaeota archaeon]|nr:MAG: TIGR00270 family protein [Candidatus Bathyarchaeota archaeon]